MSRAVETLRAATAAIWETPPAGLEGLATMHRPPSGDMPKRLYANFDAYWLAGALYQLREMANGDALDLATLAKVSARMSEVAARRLATWGFADAAATVEAAVGELGQAHDRAALKAILAELVVFLDRIHVWIDGTIPWAGMGSLSPLPAPRGDK